MDGKIGLAREKAGHGSEKVGWQRESTVELGWERVGWRRERVELRWEDWAGK